MDLEDTYSTGFFARMFEDAPQGHDTWNIIELYRPGMGYCGCVYAHLTDDPELAQALRGRDVHVRLEVQVG